MSYVEKRIKELEENGIFCAERADVDTIKQIMNMPEYVYYDIDITQIEIYLGVLTQQIYYLQQQVNIADSLEIEYGNRFRINALPLVLDSKIRSVEERWTYASLLSDELEQFYSEWQQAIIEAELKKKLSDPMIEKLNVLKRIYDEKRMEGKNRSVHKYGEG